MSGPGIDHGFLTIRLMTGGGADAQRPVGVVAWDASREWYAIRLVEVSEVSRAIPKNRLALARLAERDLHVWASDGRVPYAPSSATPWSSSFWESAHRFMSAGVRLDAPAAMQRMEDLDEEFPLLFEAIAQPKPHGNRQKVGGYLRRALGKDLDLRLSKRTRLRAFHQREEVVNRGAVGPAGAVVVEGVNLAGQSGRKDADALVSRLERIIEGEGQRRSVVILVGYVSSPGGLNGESDMKAWIESRVAPDRTFNLIGERRSFRVATRSALAQVGLHVPSFEDDLGV